MNGVGLPTVGAGSAAGATPSFAVFAHLADVWGRLGSR